MYNLCYNYLCKVSKDDVKGDDLLKNMEQKAYYQQNSQEESLHYKQETTNQTNQEQYSSENASLDKIALLHYVRS